MTPVRKPIAKNSKGTLDMICYTILPETCFFPKKTLREGSSKGNGEVEMATETMFDKTRNPARFLPKRLPRNFPGGNTGRGNMYYKFRV